MGRRRRTDPRRGPRWLRGAREAVSVVWAPADGAPIGAQAGLFAILFLAPVVFAVFFTPVFLDNVRDDWSTSHGRGVQGFLTVTRQECGRGGCQSVGTFVSTDGATEFTDSHLEKVAPGNDHHIGETVQVRWQGHGSAVSTQRTARVGFVLGVVLLTASTLAGIWCLLCVVDVAFRAIERPRSASA